MQKDINLVSETSKRSFAVADEMIFQAANGAGGKRNPELTQAYKLLVNLRQGFDSLVLTVEDTGKAKNEIRELTSQIESIESRNTNLNMERIKADLEGVQTENKALQAQLKKLVGK